MGEKGGSLMNLMIVCAVGAIKRSDPKWVKKVEV